jgi:FAD dependent monooxygenase
MLNKSQMIYPGVARIFDQFGILETIHKSITPIQRESQRWPDGSINIRGKNLGLLAQKFDMPVILFDRQRCVTHLYDGLPDKSKIRTSARVDRIEHTETGVKVFLTDGTFEEGDIVIGADGVHSRVRQLMWDYAAENEPNAIPDSDKQALFTQYKGIFGVSDAKGLPDLGPADVNIVMGQDTTELVFTQPGIVYWALIYKDEYSQPPAPFRSTQKDQDAVATRFKDIKLGPSLTFEDVYKTKTRSGHLSIEEGILSQWHAGRMVLVGDSAHKMTADIGIGANMAIESAVTLCNVLQAHLSQHQDNYHPSQSELADLFAKYQDKRFVRAKTFMDLSGKVTRMRSFQSAWKRFFIMYIATTGWMQRMQSKGFIEGFAKGPKLNYAPTRTINLDAEGWKIEEKGTPWVVYALVTSAVAVGATYVISSRL